MVSPDYTRPARVKLAVLVCTLLIICGFLVHWYLTRYERFVTRELAPGIAKATWEVTSPSGPFEITAQEDLRKLALWLRSARSREHFVPYPGTPCRLRLEMEDGRSVLLSTSDLAIVPSYVVLKWNDFYGLRIASKPDFVPVDSIEPHMPSWLLHLEKHAPAQNAKK